MDLIEMNRAKQLVCFFGESLTDEIVALIKPYQNLPLECDGMTRVITYLLSRAGVPHKTMLGTISVKGMGEFTPHYWIELVDGSIVDYKSRMWFWTMLLYRKGFLILKGPLFLTMVVR